MTPEAHFLFGACLARTGFNRRTALATAAMTLAAELPDLDVVWYFKDPVEGFAHHRGFTHTFIGVPLSAALAVLIVAGYWHWRGKKQMAKKIAPDDRPQPWHQPRWGLLFGFCLIAALSHLLLDATNNYGLRPFEPFSYRWFSWDLVFILEPVMTAVLILGLIAPSLFRLVDEEIESHAERKHPGGRGGAIFALICVAALWGLRAYEHHGALSDMSTQLYRGAEPVRMSAYPEMINPFEWRAVVETHDFFALFPVNSLSGEIDPQGEMQIFYKHEETPVTLAAKRSYLGRVYLDWAQYPMVEVEQHQTPDAGYTVRLYDLRFYTSSRSPRTLGGVVELDRNLRVVDEYMENSRKSD